MTDFFEENYKDIFQYWISPNNVKNLSILDLGSGEGRLGEYCLSNGAKDYIGIELNYNKILEAQESFPQIKFYHEDLVDYVKKCVHEHNFFDVVFLTRTLHYIQDQVELLENISKITNNIIIESGVPASEPFLHLISNFKTICADYILKIQEHVEYKENFTLYFFDKDSIHSAPSIGYLKELLNKLGFELDLTTYEKLKNKYPNEYGLLNKYKQHDLLGKYVLKFKKTKVAGVT